MNGAAFTRGLLQHPGDSGSCYEPIEETGMHATIDEGLAEAARWDGRDPIHDIDMRGDAA
ncbi:hypothetical protein [Sphingomonas sanxanigenens]|nr:hypothetical protein [Sphingomonas sanxanigenens]